MRKTPSTQQTADVEPKEPSAIIMRSPASLAAYSRNARTHSKKQIKQIADSIQRFGFTNPVLIDDRDMILAGHGRVEAARLLRHRTVPCLRISTMSEADKRAYILADNKLAQNAGWDEDLLAGELGFLITQCEEIDVSITGFSIAEIDGLLDIGGTEISAESDADDRCPAETGPAISQPGDVWLLGHSKLICGDARDNETYRLLMTRPEGGIDQAEMIFTDPPYNVPVNGHVVGRTSRTRHREFAMASGEMSSDHFTAFLKTVFQRMADNSRDGSIHFVCMDWRHLEEISNAGRSVYSELKNLIVWVKDNGGMGSFYRSRHELVFAFKNGSAPHLNSFELGQNGRYRTNVWNYRGITSPTRESRASLALHPTVKPVAMIADAMQDCSQRSGLVLDPFCGSGTVLIAAQKTGRRARAIEIDPIYCDTAVRRWEAFANDDGVLAETGETFAQVAARRLSAKDSDDAARPRGGATVQKAPRRRRQA